MTSRKNIQQKFLKATGVAARYDIAEVTVWVWTKLGKLPKPIKLSTNATRWRISDLDAHDANISLQL